MSGAQRQSHITPSPAAERTRRTAALVRWLHLYISVASFAIVLFFAITGITLNHAEWFNGEPPAPRRVTGKVNEAWLSLGRDDGIAKLEIVEALRRQHAPKGFVSEFRIEETQCAVAFKGPGYVGEATLNRKDGTYEFNETRLGFVAVINDLHKARDSGAGWSLVVDISAVVLAAVSLTGLALIVFMKRKLATALKVTVAGTALALIAWYWLLP
jgi:hypothetical protein